MWLDKHIVFGSAQLNLRHQRPRRLVRGLAGVLTMVAATAAYGSTVTPTQETVNQGGEGLERAGYVERTVSEIGPYSSEHRLQIYGAINDLFDRLWLKPEGKKVLRKAVRSNLDGMEFQLEDRDADGKADFYVYYRPNRYKQSQDFGAFFDLNGDGRPDWIVFYGGSLVTRDKSVLWWHQHGVDTNGDGRFDLWIIGAIDMDGDGYPDKGATAWVQDVDHDGRIDRAEHIVDGKVIPIKPKGKRLPLRCVMSFAQARIGESIIDLFDKISRDINANLQGD
ncbi:VCBS repeat-containing protein [Novosphingobium sp. ZN18A2]|uniref:FG-GAP repeat domain-containing protein n=1 Tax=Novosphingobium sp. ZN18A2 TaxID=3079861 RepID=UPI0030D0FEDC